MNCSYGPYKITTDLEPAGESMFVDNQATRRVVVFSDCGSASMPCADAVLLNRENNCPECDILWYECPSDMGRIYTVMPTPCGVTVTSFEDGLLASGSCDATQYGSQHFCFGKIYSSVDTFDAPDKSLVTFTFEGKTFTIQGSLGACPPDLFECDECKSGEGFEVLAELPPPPPDVSAPDFDEEETSDEDTPPTQVIPGEGRSNWVWNETTSEFGVDAVCEDEKALTDWTGGDSLPVCDSNDNPSVAAMPSGHTIVAYENRAESGLTKISLAILSSSVHMDVRYHRTLSKGTLLNNLAETGGVGNFEVYDEIFMSINAIGVPAINTQIGFLTGPMSGSIRTVTKFTRTVDKDRVTGTFEFSTTGQNVDFPDKNNVHDVQWFLLDDQGSADLPPPNQSNVITTITLPDHLNSAGEAVPVANPSVAIARNNLMVQIEQVIYVTYQAYESNQWRVYLREIVLGAVDESPPTYVAPYLFDDSQRQIEIMQAMGEPFAEAFAVGDSVWDHDFSWSTVNVRIGWQGNGVAGETFWEEIIDFSSHAWPSWNMWTGGTNIQVARTDMYLCPQEQVPLALQPCFEHPPGGRPTCVAVWNNRGTSAPDHCHIGPLIGDTDSSILGFTRTMAQKRSITLRDIDSGQRTFNFATTLRFAIIPNDINLENMPEVWFWWGKPNPITGSHAGQWRLQILRGNGLMQASAGISKRNIGKPLDEEQSVSCGLGGCGSLNCFVFRLYDKFNRIHGVNGISDVNDVTNALFDDAETPLRERWVCINTTNPADYVLDIGWNEWRVESYLRGRARHFDIYLTNNTTDGDRLMCQFREWDPLLFATPGTTTQYDWGNYHGFGFAHGNDNAQIIADRIRTEILTSPTAYNSRQQITLDGISVDEGHIFYEDDLGRDGWLGPESGAGAAVAFTENSGGSLIPLTSHHLHNFTAVGVGGGVATEWYPSAWQYTEMHGCGGTGASGDGFYTSGGGNLHPNYIGALAGLANPDVSPCGTASPGSNTDGLWSYTVINGSTHDIARAELTDGNVITNDVSMVLSVNAATKYPHVWFVLRLQNKGDVWTKGYRVRITKIAARTAFSAATMPNGMDRPAIAFGESWWKLTLYKPEFGASSGEYSTTTPDDEIYIKIVSGTPGAGETNIDWPDRLNVSGDQGPAATQWPYFRVDFTIEDSGDPRLKIYVGQDIAGSDDDNPALDPVKFDEIAYELLHTFDSPVFSGGSTERPFYGFALFSGSKADPELDDLDYYGVGTLNYVKLEALSDTVPSTGACCRFIGGCEDGLTSAQCIAQDSNNSWIENDTCWDGSTGFDCTTEIAVGAACKNTGAVNCIENVTQAEAELQGFSDWESGVDCETKGCPPSISTGSCCRPLANGVLKTCISGVTFNNCQIYYGLSPIGSNWRDSLDCSSTCGLVFDEGACCVPQGCRIENASDCAAIGGIFKGEGTDCWSHRCLGACCDGTTCSQTTDAACKALDFEFLGYGISCTGPNPCLAPDPIAACCFPDNGCLDIIESACSSGGGTWFSGQLCNEAGYDDPCPSDTPTGACCDPDGTCENSVEEITCNESGRTYRGDGSTCAISGCAQPTGACCINSVCSEGLTAEECAASGGTYLGNFFNCIPDICSLGAEDSPYVTTDIIFKPEDLWRIEIADEQYITRVKYHMQEEIIVSSLELGDGSTDGNNTIDFMFVIDHSISMDLEIFKVQQAVPALAEDMLAKGLDARFGFVIFGRGEDGTPVPAVKSICTSINSGLEKTNYVFNALQTVPDGACHSGGGLGEPAENGFTRNATYLQEALDCWFIESGATAPWATINFAINSSQFAWRANSSKFVFFISDTGDESACDSFDDGAYVNDKTTAKNSLINGPPGTNGGVVFIPAVKTSNIPIYEDVAVDSGWSGEIFDVNSDSYGEMFEAIVNQIDAVLRVDLATIVERAHSGTDNAHLKKSEIIVTYEGDLTDLWTFEKADFQFRDDHVPFPGTTTKGLVNFPFDLATGSTYGIESVHIQGMPDNWVSFGAEGPLNYDYPLGVGHRASSRAENPILISSNSTRPKVFVNNRNQVIVAYENYSSGTPQIELKGTGDFHQNSITGPKASRIQRFVTPSDFAYSHVITLPGEGMNQICDFLVDNSDITHVVWQSNRDGAWEIYYANSSDLFSPVRITQVESRSGHPSISVDDTGSIFVVYHDDRFGPFNIMLASKDEERIIPLLEQDAYMASLRNKYTHYTNILPVFIDNPSSEIASIGQFWASKIASDPGNDSESMVYKIDESTGTPSDGEDSGSEHVAVAFSSTALFGITSSGVLVQIGTVGEDKTVAVFPVTIGTVDLTHGSFENPEILDMAVDQFDRIWILVYEEEVGSGGGTFSTIPSGLPLTTFAAGDGRLRVLYIGSTNASIIATAIIEDVEDSTFGGLAITSDNRFYVVYHNNAIATEQVLRISSYPTIAGSDAVFNFGLIENRVSMAAAPATFAMTSDALDSLHIVSSDNDFYRLNKTNGTATFLTSLTTSSGSEPALPVGTTSGLAYQNLDTESLGGDQYFHIRIDFYDNIEREGGLFLSVDSRDNLEAFINDEELSDPYLDPYGTVQGLTARGIFVPVDSVGIVFFDATHFVPGFSRLSQPFSFEPNQTYFPRVFVVDATDNPRESGIPQPNSFSCSKCSRFGNNNFNASACAYSFVIQNDSGDTLYYNFQIDFYADTAKRHLIRRFEATPGSDDLQYMEVDNVPATDLWTESGLPVNDGDFPFIQIHPVLDPQAGFLCGVLYTVQVNECSRSIEEECSNFSILSTSNWIGTLIGETLQTVSTDLEIAPEEDGVTLGLSMALIGDHLGVAWRSDDNNVIYSEFDGTTWVTQNVFALSNVAYVSLTSIQNSPAIQFTYTSGGLKSGLVVIFDGSTWNTVPGNLQENTSGDFPNPRTIIEYNNAPLATFISSGTTGQPTYLTPDKGGVWETNPACGTFGSCVTDTATINGLPAVAYISLNTITYAEWNEDFGVFSNVQGIGSGDAYKGHVGITEINGQPAVAYIKVSGSRGRLIYSRFNGSSWQETVVTAQLDFNKHVSMTNINGVPSIVYSTKQTATTSDLRYAVFNGSNFTNEIVDEDLNIIDPIVDIIEFQNGPAISITSNPFRMYFFRQGAATSVRELLPVYTCECSSKIFTNRLTHLNEVSRWEASAHGFSDTRVTDSTGDSFRPIIQTRTTDAAIILWEDNGVTENCTSPPCIRAATFRNVNQDQLRGSGTQSWFDYDFGISGQDPSMSLDMYDRVNTVYEKSKPPDPATGFHGKHASKDELPGNELYRKVCDFAVGSGIQAPSGETEQGCDLSSLETNTITFDEFISSQIVRKIKVKDDFVSYYTYNASRMLTPIVSNCNLELEIHGTPEIVALRFKNENSSVFGSWCAWSPQIGDFVMEKKYQISNESGVKEVCIQAMTYSGITSEFCMPIVADYETIVFQSKFYKDTPEVSNFAVANNELFPAGLDDILIELPLSEGISVANLASTTDENTPVESKVLIEITPNQTFTDETIVFDVVQQGSNDTLGLTAQRGKNNDGRVVYRGEFVIEREDNVFNIDGLARVNPAFPSSCGEQGSGSLISDQFTRDQFNVIGENLTVEATEVVDALSDFRQTVSGQIGVSVDVRGTEDPYFIFGDPNYSLKQSEGRRPGVPFEIAQTAVSEGESIEQEISFCPPPNPSDPNLGCPEGTAWNGWPDCNCTETTG